MKPRPITTMIFCAVIVASHAQVPLIPSWSLVAPACSGSKSCVTWDSITLNAAWSYANDALQQPVRRFHADGTEISAVPPVQFPASQCGLERITSNGDTLVGLVSYSYSDPDITFTMSITGVLAPDGRYFNVVNMKNAPVSDFYRDSHGSIVALSSAYRQFATNGWPLSHGVLPTTDRFAASDDQVYCGRTPDIVVLDRITMESLTTLTVPSSGPALKTLFTTSPGLVHYASLTSSLGLDVGVVDMSGEVQWNMVIPPGTIVTITGIVADDAGNTWVSVNRIGTQSGLLYRFSGNGIMTGSYVYGHTIDDLACSGDMVFLSGQDAAGPSTVYLAAIYTDITTTIPAHAEPGLVLSPNPTSDRLIVSNMPPGATSIAIADATGRVVQEMNGSIGISSNIQVFDLPNGTYLLRISGGESRITRSFSVAH